MMKIQMGPLNTYNYDYSKRNTVPLSPGHHVHPGSNPKPKCLK